jgi:lipid A 4'-phosphatase
MSYLKTSRARVILLSFLASSLLLFAFPDIDILISRMFFDNGFYLAHQRWTRILHECVGAFVALSMATVVGIYAFNKLSKRNLCAIDGKKTAYLFLVLVLGAGLIVNATLKDNFGRVRPRDVQEFGGSRHFTPAFVITNGCKTNCSFSSGDAAGAFFSLALALALSRRRAITAVAVGFGVVVSFSRIAIGAHFLSDTVTSYFVMLVVADVLYYYMLLPVPELIEHAATAGPGVLVRGLEKHSLPLS